MLKEKSKQTQNQNLKHNLKIKAKIMDTLLTKGPDTIIKRLENLNLNLPEINGEQE
jgi:hypothetical protein